VSRSKALPAAVIIIAVLLPLLNALPTWSGYLEERPPERVFLGFRYMAGDHFQYASFARQAADDGRLFMENRFTTEPQKGRFLLLYMWLAGEICRFTGLDVPGAWEVLRLVTGIAFMLAAWSFAGLLFKEAGGRMLAYLLIAFSGGIGWILYLITGEPAAGVTMASLKDAFNYQWNWSTFGSMLVPMWVAPAALLLVCASLLARESPGASAREKPPAPSRGKPKAVSGGTPAASIWRPAVAAALPPLIWFMHPYTGMVAYLAFGLFPLMPIAGAAWRLEAIPWPRVRANFRSALPSLLSFAVVAAYLLWAQNDEVYATSGGRVFTWNPTYSVFLYPFAYGLLLPLGIYGMRYAESIPARAREMTAAWLLAAVALSVNPFLSGVKFQYLIHLPLALFAAHGIRELRLRSARAKALSSGLGAVVFGALLFVNTPLILLKDMPKTAADPEIYSSSAEIDAMRFLRTQPGGTVLSSSRSGNRIAWLSAKTVYIGHWFLTIDINNKAAEVAGFFDARVPVAQKRAWLSQKGIRYVYAGPEEKGMGGVDPALGLGTIYDRNGVTIYAVP